MTLIACHRRRSLLPACLAQLARRCSLPLTGLLNRICRPALTLTLLIIAVIPACSRASAPSGYSHPTQRPYVIDNKIYYPIPSSYGFSQSGIASWYGGHFHGRKTSNGETYNMYAMTAAHKTLPMHTVLLVRNLENGREIVVRVNDRGPFVSGRIIDLSYTAAGRLAMADKGTARVQITALGDADKNAAELREFASRFYNGEFYVQIGSFTEKNNALRLQNRFRQAGHTAVIQLYDGPGARYHRVQVYIGTTLQGALQAQAVLLRRGYAGAFVIAR